MDKNINESRKVVSNLPLLPKTMEKTLKVWSTEEVTPLHDPQSERALRLRCDWLKQAHARCHGLRLHGRDCWAAKIDLPLL